MEFHNILEENSIKESNMNHHQDIARHSFCDMVNDYDRNNKYASAIERVIQAAKDRDGYAYVFDVGCGSGLLSMLSLKFGADFVFAVEQNSEMSRTARIILEQNGFCSDIEIVITRLEDVKRPTLKRSFPMKEIAFPNIVTAELFDSEMIGEDALRIYQAIKPLVATNAFFVPTSGRIFIQIVNSTFFNRCHVLSKTIEVDGRKIEAPVEILACSGTSEIQDLHLDRFSKECSEDYLTDPIAVFEFDFSSITSAIIKESKRLFLQLKRPIYSTDKLCILFWWSSRMDILSTSEMTTAPHWILGIKEQWSPWREHWLPIVYHFPIKQYEYFLFKHYKHDKIELFCSHDEFQFKFSLIDIKEHFENIQNNEYSKTKTEILQDDCTCEVHRYLGRAGMYQFNNQKRYSDWLHGFNNYLDGFEDKNDYNLLFVGDFSPLPFLIAQDKRIKKIWIDVSDYGGQQKMKCFRKYLKTNSTSKIVFYSNGSINFDILVIDDYLTTKSILTEQFSNEIIELIENYSNSNDESLKYYPEFINIHMNYVYFEKLYKNYCSVESTQEFDFTSYDKLIMNSRQIVDDLPDLVNCSEYRSTISSYQIKNILKISPLEIITKRFECTFKLRIPKEISNSMIRKRLACVFWLSFQNDDYKFSYNQPAIDEHRFCKWPYFTNQFVQFFEQINGIENIIFGLETIDNQRLRIVWNNEEYKLELFIKN